MREKVMAADAVNSGAAPIRAICIEAMTLRRPVSTAHTKLLSDTRASVGRPSLLEHIAPKQGDTPMIQQTTRYGLSITIGLPYEQAAERTWDALASSV